MNVRIKQMTAAEVRFRAEHARDFLLTAQARFEPGGPMASNNTTGLNRQGAWVDSWTRDEKGSLDLSWTGVIGCSEQTGPGRHVSIWVHGDRFEYGAALGDPESKLAGVFRGRHRRFGPAEVAVAVTAPER